MDHKPIATVCDIGFHLIKKEKRRTLDKDAYVRALKTASLTHEFVRDVEQALGEHMHFFEIEHHRVQPDTYNEVFMQILQKVAFKHFGKTHHYTPAHTEIFTQCKTQIEQRWRLKAFVGTHGGPPGLPEPPISISIQINRIETELNANNRQCRRIRRQYWKQ